MISVFYSQAKPGLVVAWIIEGVIMVLSALLIYGFFKIAPSYFSSKFKELKDILQIIGKTITLRQSEDKKPEEINFLDVTPTKLEDLKKSMDALKIAVVSDSISTTKFLKDFIDREGKTLSDIAGEVRALKAWKEKLKKTKKGTVKFVGLDGRNKELEDLDSQQKNGNN